jgi:hypothetical protein
MVAAVVEKQDHWNFFIRITGVQQKPVDTGAGFIFAEPHFVLTSHGEAAEGVLFFFKEL